MLESALEGSGCPVEMIWYRELKFKTNPLDVRPNTNLVGLEQEEKQLRNHIEKGEICFLNGLTGSGKTSLLLRLQQQMKKHKFVYLDAHDLEKDFSLAQELRSKRSFFDKLRLRNHPTKTPVLIIDEFQATDPDLVLEARAKWENPNNKRIKAIVISQISKKLKNVVPSFRERLGSRIVLLRNLDNDELKAVLRLRLQIGRNNYAEKFSDEALSFIVKCSGGNPRRLLEYTDEIFDFHNRKFGDRNPILLNDYHISYHGAKEILGLDKVFVDGFDMLGERHSLVENAKKTQGLDKYTDTELRVLKFLKSSPKTIKQIADRFRVSESTASRYLSQLKKKEAVLYAGKKRNRTRWQIEPGTKRLMVNV